jgi:hypothetical protein
MTVKFEVQQLQNGSHVLSGQRFYMTKAFLTPAFFHCLS